jgi:hypothetical protein
MLAMTAYSPLDEALDRLCRAGWSVGDVAKEQGWLVTGTNGEDYVVLIDGTSIRRPDVRVIHAPKINPEGAVFLWTFPRKTVDNRH